MMPFLLNIHFFAPSGAGSWGNIPSWLLLSGGSSAAAGLSALPLGEITGTDAAVGGLIITLGTALGFYLKLAKAKEQFAASIIQQIEAKNKPSQVEVQNPLAVVAATRCVEHAELLLKLEGYVNRSDLRDAEKRLEDRMEARFTQLDDKRSSDIRDLHIKIESTTETVRAEIEDKARETRQQIQDMPGELIDLLQKTGAIGGTKR